MTILGIGTTALLAFQRSLAVTGKNIGNSATDGYSRQRMELMPGELNQYSITRISDRFVNAQLRVATADRGHAETRAAFAGQVDRLLADSSTGLAPALSRFFDTAQDLADDPTSETNRTLMFGESGALVERFNDLNARIEEQRNSLNGQIKLNVEEINQLATSLADLNARIVDRSGGRTAPNELLDQRDLMLNKLAEKVDVRTTLQDDGSMNVFIGSGQTLVIGGTARELRATPLSGDPLNPDVGYVQSDGSVVKINRFISGGELGALLESRTSVLDPAQNQLGRIAVNLSTLFNEQNKLGLDQNGNLGGDIFTVPTPVVRTGLDNAGDELPGVRIADVRQLTADDYRLRFNGSEFSLQRLPNQETVPLTPDPDTGELTAEGLAIDTTVLAGAAAGDSWLIQPTREAASRIVVNPQLLDGSGFATAGAMQAAENINNRGEAQVKDIRAIDTTNPALFTPVTATFDAASQRFNVGGTSVDLDPSGITTIQLNGWELRIQGTPEHGDTFAIGKNEQYVGDNRNMLELTGLAQERAIENKTTYSDSYTSIMAEIGIHTKRAQIAFEASSKVYEDVSAQQQAISGVNLDEEAANMIRFQQAYQAAAQMISVSNTLFETLLGATR